MMSGFAGTSGETKANWYCLRCEHREVNIRIWSPQERADGWGGGPSTHPELVIFAALLGLDPALC